MIILKIVFAILICIPIAALAIYLFGKLVSELQGQYQRRNSDEK